MGEEYIAVRFEGNGSKKWNGQEWDGIDADVPKKTVVRLGEYTEDGYEKAQVIWPGKSGKPQGTLWHCVILPDEAGADDVAVGSWEAELQLYEEEVEFAATSPAKLARLSSARAARRPKRTTSDIPRYQAETWNTKNKRKHNRQRRKIRGRGRRCKIGGYIIIMFLYMGGARRKH